MKLSVLFLICSLSMTYAAESYAQKTMISLEVRNETVGTVLEKLKKESGFDFFFNNKHVDLKRIVSVSANNNNIFKILDLPKGTRGCGPARKPFTSPKDSSERCFRESPGRTRRWW